MQPREWKKILANQITDKELISKIYKNSYNLTTTTTKIPLFKNEQRIHIDIYPEKIYKWPMGTWKDVQHQHQENANQSHNKILLHTY